MTTEIRPVPDSPKDDARTSLVSTPEGDNESLPDQPLAPSLDGLETPLCSEPDEYKRDEP